MATMSAAPAAALVATAAPVTLANAVAPAAPIVAAPTMVAGAREAATMTQSPRPIVRARSTTVPSTTRAGRHPNGRSDD